MSAPSAAHLSDDQAQDYVFGALDDRARADVAAHVARCAACAATVTRFDREQAALFELMRAAAGARPPGRATEWSAVRDRIVAPRHRFGWAWGWAAGTIGGLSAPFLFAVGVASAAGVSYAALPPVRHAVDRVLGIAAATPAPTLAPTTEPTAVADDPATATPTTTPTPTPAVDIGAPSVDDADRDDGAPSHREVAGSPTALSALTPIPTASASPGATATGSSADPAIGSGGAPAAATTVPASPAPNPTTGIQVPPGGPTPPVRPTPDRDGRGGRGGPGGGRLPLPPPPGGQPGPGPGPGPRPTEGGGPPPGPTPSANETPGRRDRGPGRRGHDRPPDGTRGERTPEPERP